MDLLFTPSYLFFFIALQGQRRGQRSDGEVCGGGPDQAMVGHDGEASEGGVGDDEEPSQDPGGRAQEAHGAGAERANERSGRDHREV